VNNRTNVRGRERVVVAANGQATRAGIRMALEAGNFVICAEVGSVEDLVAAVERDNPEACVLDIDLHGDALGAVSLLAEKAPSTALVILAEDESDAQFLSAMRLGASGYLAKTIAPEALSSAVRAVVNGEPAIPRLLVGVLINEFRDRPVRRYLAVRGAREAELTPREWEVLGCMREGLSTREIAERLLISEVTVRRHIGAIVKKLDATSRSDAVNLLESA
jgi:DNA-binding NarL/FixJ family response regulator